MMKYVWFYTAYTAYNDTPHDVQRDGNGQIIFHKLYICWLKPDIPIANSS